MGALLVQVGKFSAFHVELPLVPLFLWSDLIEGFITTDLPIRNYFITSILYICANQVFSHPPN